MHTCNQLAIKLLKIATYMLTGKLLYMYRCIGIPIALLEKQGSKVMYHVVSSSYMMYQTVHLDFVTCMY